MSNQSISATIVGAFTILALIIAASTFLVWSDDVSGDTWMAVIAGPVVGGIIGFVAGTKGVQQGSQATATPPPSP